MLAEVPRFARWRCVVMSSDHPVKRDPDKRGLVEIPVGLHLLPDPDAAELRVEEIRAGNRTTPVATLARKEVNTDV